MKVILIVLDSVGIGVLSIITELKLTDKGLVDVHKMKLVGLFV